VLAMFGSILLLFFLPWIDRSPVRSGSYRPVFKRFFWLLVADVLILGYIGGAEINAWRVAVGQIAGFRRLGHGFGWYDVRCRWSRDGFHRRRRRSTREFFDLRDFRFVALRASCRRRRARGGFRYQL